MWNAIPRRGEVSELAADGGRHLVGAERQRGKGREERERIRDDASRPTEELGSELELGLVERVVEALNAET